MWSDSSVFAHVLPTCSARQRLTHRREHWPPAGAAPSLSPQGLSPDPWASPFPPPALSPPVLGSSGFETRCLPVPSGSSEWPHGWARVWAQLRCPFLHQEVSFPASWDSRWGLLTTPTAVCPRRHPGSPSAGTAQRSCAGGRRVGLTMVLIPTVTGSRDTGCSSHSQLLPPWAALS